MELDITEPVEAFRQSLNCSWRLISALAKRDSTGSYVDDLLQANWEMLVEASIDFRHGVVLEVYGNGADCNIRSSRVWKPQAQATTPVYVRYVGNELLLNQIDNEVVSGLLKLDHFATILDGWPSVDCPFDHVVLSDRYDTVIPIRDLRYYVVA
jgi:hypothetical protein